MTLEPHMIKGYLNCPEHGHRLLRTDKIANEAWYKATVYIYKCLDERDDTEYERT